MQFERAENRAFTAESTRLNDGFQRELINDLMKGDGRSLSNNNRTDARKNDSMVMTDIFKELGALNELSKFGSKDKTESKADYKNKLDAQDGERKDKNVAEQKKQSELDVEKTKKDGSASVSKTESASENSSERNKERSKDANPRQRDLSNEKAQEKANEVIRKRPITDCGFDRKR